MKQIASNRNENSPEQMDLTKAFWRWFSLSVLALMVAAAIPALSADVFIDEGDGDFAATPVSTPMAQTSVAEPVADKKPASVDKAPASEEGGGAGMDLDSAVGDLEPPAGAPAAGSADMPGDMAPPIDEKPVEKKKSAPRLEKASKKKSSAKLDKKKDKKKKGAKSDKKKDKKPGTKSDKKKKSAKKPKKESTAATEKSAKRKVAAATSFAGGQYVTTSKDCAMESSPGAGDSVGTARASRKLWVEDSGNTSYWKVFGKAGNAAFVSRDCF